MFCNKFHAVTKRSQMHPNTTKHTETLLLGRIRWIACVRCEKYYEGYEMIPNAPKHNETHQNMSLGSNGVDQVRLSWKITMCLRGTKFCINWTSSICCATSFMQLRNEPKYYEMHQNISLGSNRVDWVHSLWKIPRWLRGTNFCINCTSSVCFAISFIQLRNDPKCTQTLWNTQKKWV